MKKKLLLSLIAACGMFMGLMAQNKTISGTVTGTDGAPIAGATVVVEGTSVGTTTDAAGHYTIAAPSDAQLNVSFIGYKETLVAVAGQTKIDITLSDDQTAIDDVVVVAFGSKRKQDLVGSVSAVKKDLIQNAQTASISSALEGAVAGLSLVSSTGQPGEDAAIYLRGIGSLSGSNAALIVVDGTPFNGKLSDINPQDIASISVSKDAVSNSLYGSRAAGGVVMVTTKTGSHDKVRVNFQGSWGVSQRAYRDYNITNDPGEFYQLTWYGLRNTQWAGGLSIEDANKYASEHLLEVLDNYNSFIIPNGEYLVNPDGSLNPNRKVRYNDTFANALFNTAFRQEYTVSASGGSKSTDYYMSVGYLDNDSYIIGSSFNRFSARANVNSQLRKWLKIGTNISYSKTEQNGVKESKGIASNPFSVARSWAPIYPVHAYDAQGNLKYDSNGKPMYDSGQGETDGSSARQAGLNENVVASMKEDILRDTYHNLTTRSYAEIRFLKDFTFTINYSYDYTNDNATTYYTPLLGDGRAFNGRGYRYGVNYMTTNLSQILAYDKYFGQDNLHNISAKAGHEYYQYRYSYFSGSKTNFFDPKNPELDNGGNMQSISSYNKSHNIEGYFAMADYNYAHKYYVSASYRADGTSRFLNRWGHFWSVGASWRISAENFMHGASSWLNDLKLRASYGTQGNENVLNYTPYQDQYEVVWDGASFGYSPSFYGNPDLTWEKQTTFDIGLDFKLFNVIYGSVEWYNRKTSDMLFQRLLASSGGRPYNWENIGAMRNSGIEFELNFDVVKKHDLQWTISFVGSHYNNVLVTLPEEYRADGMSAGSYYKRLEGHNIYEYYTYMYAGMDYETGEAMWYTDELDEDNNVIGRTTTKVYNDATKYMVGKTALPDFHGGLNTSFYWKGIDLSIATAFQIGGWAYDSDYLSTMNMSNFYVNHNKDLWDTWNPETKSGKYPIWDGNSSNKYASTSDAHLVKASYISLRNVTVGYSFPKTWMKKLGIEGIRIYFTADNVALKSARQGFDPRTSLSGSNSDYSGYAPLRTISGGLNLTF